MSQFENKKQSSNETITQELYRDVPGLGNVKLSIHAQKKMKEDGISQREFRKVLLEPLGDDIPDGMNILWRERDGIRIILNTYPKPYSGAMLIKTVYRIQKHFVESDFK